jgi:hypothetical protein
VLREDKELSMNTQLTHRIGFGIAAFLLAIGFEASAQAQWTREVHRYGVFGREVHKASTGSGAVMLAAVQNFPQVLAQVPNIINAVNRDAPTNSRDLPMTRAEAADVQVLLIRLEARQAEANALLNRTANLVNNQPPVGFVFGSGQTPPNLPSPQDHAPIPATQQETGRTDPWLLPQNVLP